MHHLQLKSHYLLSKFPPFMNPNCCVFYLKIACEKVIMSYFHKFEYMRLNPPRATWAGQGSGRREEPEVLRPSRRLCLFEVPGSIFNISSYKDVLREQLGPRRPPAG